MFSSAETVEAPCDGHWSGKRPWVGFDPTVNSEIVASPAERDGVGGERGVRGLLRWAALCGLSPPVRHGPEVGLTGRAPSTIPRSLSACGGLAVLLLL